MNIFFQKHAENETRRLVLDLLFLFLRNRLNLEVKATGLFFLTAIWLPLGQLWDIIKEAASLTQFLSLRFTYSTQRSPGAL